MQASHTNTRLFTHTVNGNTAPLTFYIDCLSIPHERLDPLFRCICANGGCLTQDSRSENIDIIVGNHGFSSTYALVASEKPVLYYIWIEECVRVGRVLGEEEAYPWQGYLITDFDGQPDGQLNGQGKMDEDDERGIEQDLQGSDVHPIEAKIIFHPYQAHASRLPTPISPVRESAVMPVPLLSPEQRYSPDQEEPLSPTESHPNDDSHSHSSPDDDIFRNRSPSPDLAEAMPSVTVMPTNLLLSVIVVRRSGRLNDGQTALLHEPASTAVPKKGKVQSPKKPRTRQSPYERPPLPTQSKNYTEANFLHVVEYLEAQHFMSVPAEFTPGNSTLWEGFAETGHGNGHTAKEWEAYATTYNVRITAELEYRVRMQLLNAPRENIGEGSTSRSKGKCREEQRGEGSRRVRFTSAV